MSKIELKHRILEEGRKEHESVIHDFQVRIKELRESDSVVNDDVMDDQEKSMHNENSRRVSTIADQLNFAIEELNLLNSIIIEEPLHEEVGFGTVVETDVKTFFVSVSIDDFTVDGVPFFGLSTKSPLYKEMEGKKPGDRFSFGTRHYKIIDLY